MFGSAQLIEQDAIKPAMIRQKDIVDDFSKEYMYFGCIQFIHQVKKGPFSEHSPMLNDIANVQTWSKVNSGLAKMYQDEVFKKHVIIQHFLFGKLLSYDLMKK